MKPIHVLIVDDSESDIFLMRSLLEQQKLYLHIEEVYDGEQALQFLKNESPFEEKHRPDLIILDINMPRLNGFEVLKEIQNFPEYKRIPVIILTTSKEDEDIMRSYELQASCYVTKPVDLNQFQKIVAQLSDFWFTIVQFPNPS